MELNRLLEIANEKELCDFCTDCDGDACIDCEKVKGITWQELREYYTAVKDALRRTAEDDKAREEGRLHIATIADGTTIFRPIEYNELFDEPARVFEDSYIYGYTETVYGKMGKEWYLTRQEAEAALGGDQHG